jgi:hypothetical protein
MNPSDEEQFSHEAILKDKLGNMVIKPEDLRKLRKQMFGNYIFLLGNLTCSLEFRFLSRCFSENVSDSNACLEMSKNYGNCIYSRYEKPAERATQTLCQKNYKKYTRCMWMNKFTNQSCDVKWNEFSRCVSYILAIDKNYVKR